MKIALVGDIGFFGRYSIENNPDVFDYFREASEYLSKFDYVIGNLELPFLKDGQAIGAKSAYLKSDPKNIALLEYLNINIVTLANNHIYDFGRQGVESTIELLERHNIKHFGVNNKALTLDDAKIALHGYCCYSTNPYGLDADVNKLNIDTVSKKLTNYHQNGYLNIVSIHAGLEHVNFPAYHDIQMARQFSQICPYVYYGHHPHVLQGIEKVDDSLHAYSLGNFCFDDVYTNKSSQPLVKQNVNNKSSVILELEVVDGKLIEHLVTDLFMADDRLAIGTKDIELKLQQYTEFLSTDESEYGQHRNSLLTKYIEGRKSMRNLKWYIKRLNYRSAIILMRAKYNTWQHKKNVLEKISARSGR
jgi:poly-gamma-glutamate synthesis protein (capsule biosynthesis protein)